MDRRILRAKAKAEYKKMIKGMAKNKRPAFKVVFPMIRKHLLKPVLEGNAGDSAEVVSTADESILEDFLVDMTNESDEGTNFDEQAE